MKYLFLFTDFTAFLKTFLIFAAVFAVIALWRFSVILIHRKIPARRGETMTDILTFKCIALSYAAASLCFLTFRSYVAIALWPLLGWLLIKKVLSHDLIAMAYFEAFPSYELHPIRKLKDFKQNGPAPEVMNRKKFKELSPYDGYGWYCYLHTSLLSVVAYGGKLIFEATGEIPGIMSLVEFDCLALFVIVSLLLSLLKSSTGLGGRNMFKALLCFIVAVVMMNLLYFGFS